MQRDPRRCHICNSFLLKQDRNGFVLIIHCDVCNAFVHEECYMIHHMKMHNLIAIVMESEIPEFEILSLDKSSNTNPIYPKHHPTEP
ncbi:hypothetical protein [Candidatus Hodarchaeum mangrovi]